MSHHYDIVFKRKYHNLRIETRVYFSNYFFLISKREATSTEYIVRPSVRTINKKDCHNRFYSYSVILIVCIFYMMGQTNDAASSAHVFCVF